MQSFKRVQLFNSICFVAIKLPIKSPVVIDCSTQFVVLPWSYKWNLLFHSNRTGFTEIQLVILTNLFRWELIYPFFFSIKFKQLSTIFRHFPARLTEITDLYFSTRLSSINYFPFSCLRTFQVENQSNCSRGQRFGRINPGDTVFMSFHHVGKGK